MGTRATAVNVLIIVNVIVFAIGSFLPEIGAAMFKLFPLYFPENQNFRYWQFVSSMFMHGSFIHLFFNMYALWAFGTPLEYMWGKKNFVIFYFLCGIGAGIIYTGFNYFEFNAIYKDLLQAGLSVPQIQSILETGRYSSSLLSVVSKDQLADFYNLFDMPAVGASGAIYGILVGFGFLYPNAKLALIFLPFPIAAKYFVPMLITLDLFSGLTGFSIFGGGIAHFAHVGGAIIGFLLMWFWRKKNIIDDEDGFTEAEVVE